MKAANLLSTASLYASGIDAVSTDDDGGRLSRAIATPPAPVNEMNPLLDIYD
nr:hypothetical protein [Leptolyngbya sp. Cla-17]